MDGQTAGCVALRPLGPDVCEMKRLYVRPAFRGAGAGRALVESVRAEAKSVGSRRMGLDTLATMESAQALYRAFGFRPASPYYDNPISGAVYLERTLD